ncbi:MAG: ferritin-like domain-containing protein [Deltaproteobacteria bacterium]|nr:ferritin-like domain-containing protein [Deltaproteobacteria bacterium]
MIRELWKKLNAILRQASTGNGKPQILDPAEILGTGYRDMRRLAEQITAHAERAPYPHVAERLRQIAFEKQRCATILKEKILGLGRELEESQLELKSGKNHWERMVQDLEDQKSLETFFSEQAARLVDEAAEIADLLKKVVAEQLPHKETLLDLVMRADPQAEQN